MEEIQDCWSCEITQTTQQEMLNKIKWNSKRCLQFAWVFFYSSIKRKLHKFTILWHVLNCFWRGGKSLCRPTTKPCPNWVMTMVARVLLLVTFLSQFLGVLLWLTKQWIKKTTKQTALWDLKKNFNSTVPELKLRRGRLMQQENDPKHWVNEQKNSCETVYVLDRSSQSPDFNLI